MDDTKIYTPGEAAAKVAPYLTEITHNTVKHCGQIRYYGGGVHIDSRPASMAMMPGNHIAHNHFQDLSRNGVFTFRNQGGNVLEFNEIHDCLQTTIDGACIHFASMNRFNAPNYILNNYLYLLTVFLFGLHSVYAQHNPKSWGDLGNGRYRNMILPAVRYCTLGNWYLQLQQPE